MHQTDYLILDQSEITIMRKFVSYFIVLLLLFPILIVAQPGTSEVEFLKQEQAKFQQQLAHFSMDSNIVHRLSRFIKSEVDSIYFAIRSDQNLQTAEKEKAVRSLYFFIKEMGDNLSKQKLDIYDIQGALESYKSILSTLLNHQPVGDMLKTFGSRRSQLLAAAFSQYKEYPLLDDIAVYKRVASAPEFILQFLETKPRFRFADSLLLNAAVHDPMKFIYYLNRGKPDLQDNIRNTSNKYLQQIISLAGDKNASEFLPFTIQLAEKRITPDSILHTRTDVTKFFQLMVNTLKGSVRSDNANSVFQKLLRNGVKEKSFAFYVNQLNELHSATDATRFASVKGLRPEDLYYIITSSGEELYTSSYLGLYKRLMEHFKNQSADSLFELVQYDNFRTFMHLAANYNVLSDFLTHMPGEKASALLNRFISGIETDLNTGLEKAMDISDSFTGLDTVPVISGMIRKELQSNLDRCRSAQQYFGMRLYSILLQVFDLVQQKNAFNKLWTTLGNYDLLKRDALQNMRGEITELVLFYGDEDGVASFNNFLKLYKDTTKWEVSKNTSWVTIHSRSDQPVAIYASLPLDTKEELDLKAQDSLFAFLEQQSIEPSVLIHRGHSYHLSNTLKRLTPSVKLAILGSCGAYNSALSIASINPDVQIIGSKKTGSKSINDPIIDVINETLLNKQDLSWNEIWEKLSTRFSKDEFTLNLFNEYIPPGKNVSLFILKLFNFYNRFASNQSKHSNIS